MNGPMRSLWLYACLGLCFLLGGLAANAQEERVDVSRLIEDFRNHPYPLFANQLADAHAIAAIPVLTEKFNEIRVSPFDNAFLNDDLSSKLAAASALVRLGVKEGLHWDYLVAQAEIAVQSDAPYPIRRDAEGNFVRQELSTEFLVWAKAHKVNPESEAANQIGMPLRLIHLATAGDARSLPLLRKAVESPNPLVQVTGARGLAILQDNASIPLIIDACARVPSDAAYAIAQALPFFDDPVAQKAAERFIADPAFVASLREKLKRYGPRGVYR